MVRCGDMGCDNRRVCINSFRLWLLSTYNAFVPDRVLIPKLTATTFSNQQTANLTHAMVFSKSLAIA